MATTTGHDEYSRLLNLPEGRGRWQVCLDCKLAARTPTLTPQGADALYASYRDVAFRNETPEQYWERIMTLRPAERENFARLRQLERWLDTGQAIKPESVFDIGCGGGVWLGELSQTYPKILVFGCEPTSNFAELAQSKLSNACITNCSIEQFPKSNLKYDMVTIFHVLEHVDKPLQILRQATDLVAKNGILWVECPSIEDFDVLPMTHDRFKIGHRWYFSEQALLSMTQNLPVRLKDSGVFVSVRGRNNCFVMAEKLI